ncbi:hypothetical protein PAP_01990 [Palaeococcus pacificus DY20341]|uniref:PDGLE domain-containing protein n=2 Tax=Palaeococcus TaxID=83867 RepID=A0A075LQ54_9EURY|nr:hypothetical protein PAP_01990 [Palaeococcus pacificus DY20341]
MNRNFNESSQDIMKGVMIPFLMIVTGVVLQVLLKAANVSDPSQLPITGPALEKFEMLFPKLSTIQDMGNIIGAIGFFIGIFALTTAGALYWKQKQE